MEGEFKRGSFTINVLLDDDMMLRVGISDQSLNKLAWTSRLSTASSDSKEKRADRFPRYIGISNEI